MSAGSQDHMQFCPLKSMCLHVISSDFYIHTTLEETDSTLAVHSNSTDLDLQRNTVKKKLVKSKNTVRTKFFS